MSKLGSAQTEKFSIGTAELRVGPLTSANRLLQANSVGLVDNTTLDVTQNAVDLVGTFPRAIQATAIIDQATQLTATLREYSRRNLTLLLGNGYIASSADVSSTLTTDVAAAATLVPVTSATGFAVDDVVIIYPENNPELVTVSQVASIAINDITLKTGQETLVAYNAATDTSQNYVMLKAQQLAIGNILQTNYFATMVIQKEFSTGRPAIQSFWKAAIGSGMSLGNSAEDFSSTDLVIKCVDPTVADYTTGDLSHLADIIPTNPTGMLIAGGDTLV